MRDECSQTFHLSKKMSQKITEYENTPLHGKATVILVIGILAAVLIQLFEVIQLLMFAGFIVSFVTIYLLLPRLILVKQLHPVTYIFIALVLFGISALYKNESGLSYAFSPLLLHILVTVKSTKQHRCLIVVLVGILTIALWQPHVALAIFTASRMQVFLATIIALASAFLLAFGYVREIRSRERAYRGYTAELTNYIQHIRNASLILLTISKKGDITFMNSAAKKLFTDNNCSQFTLPNDFASNMGKALLSNQTIKSQVKINRNAYRFSFKPNEDRFTVSIIGEQESDIRSSGELANIIFSSLENTADAFIIVDDQLQIIYTNHSVAKLFNTANPEALLSKKWLSLFSEQDAERLSTVVLPKIKPSNSWAGRVSLENTRNTEVVVRITRLSSGHLMCTLIDTSVISIESNVVEQLNFTAPSLHPNHFSLKQENSLQKRKQAKVLIVDDDEINLYIAEHLVKQFGFHTDCTNNGEEALKLHARNRYDVVILDLNMPRMDGYELAHRLRDQEGECPLIIAASADAHAPKNPQFIRSGIAASLEKPYNSDDLCRLLQTNGIAYERTVAPENGQ